MSKRIPAYLLLFGLQIRCTRKQGCAENCVNGHADRILPIAATAIRPHKAVKSARLLVVKDGPHGVIWTHADQVNHGLVEFLGR